MFLTRLSLGILLLALVWPITVQAESGGIGQVTVTAIEPQGGAFPFSNSVYVSVADVDGNPIPNLGPAELALFENEVKVEAQPTPFSATMNVAIVFDNSGDLSLWESGKPRSEHARAAALSLVDTNNRYLRDGDRVAVFAFANDQPKQVSSFDADHNRVFNDALQKLDTAGNKDTALIDIIRQAVDAMSGQSTYVSPTLRTRRNVLLLFSDGVDKTSSSDLDEVIKAAREARAVIFAVGTGPNLRQETDASKRLRRLASETGGSYLWYRPGQANAETELTALFDKLSAQRNLYHLSYTSMRCDNTAQIRVVAEKDGNKRDASQTFSVPEFPPVISLENVTEGATYSNGQPIKVAVGCSRAPISKVEFKLNDELVHTATVSPFEYLWNPQDTAQKLGATPGDGKDAKIEVIAYAGQYQTPKSLTVKAAPPSPTPTLAPTSTPPGGGVQTINLEAWLAIISSFIVLAAVIWLISWMRGNNSPLPRTRGETEQYLPSTGPALARLIVESEPHGGRCYEIRQDAVLGSHDRMAEIVFDWDRFVSRKHAEIVVKDGSFYLFDRMSKNQTWVNDRLVPPSNSKDSRNGVPLQRGDRIKLGSQLVLRFETGDQPPVQPSEPIPFGNYSPQTEPADSEVHYHPQTESMEPRA